MTNCIDPNHLTPQERLDEVASILAVGIIRLKLKEIKKENNPSRLAEKSLDVSRVQSLNDPDQRSLKPRKKEASWKGGNT